jgi:hypothetical protein
MALVPYRNSVRTSVPSGCSIPVIASTTHGTALTLRMVLCGNVSDRDGLRPVERSDSGSRLGQGCAGVALGRIPVVSVLRRQRPGAARYRPALGLQDSGAEEPMKTATLACAAMLAMVLVAMATACGSGGSHVDVVCPPGETSHGMTCGTSVPADRAAGVLLPRSWYSRVPDTCLDRHIACEA